MFWSRIPEIIATAERETPAAVEKAVMDIEAGAKARSRVDTGQMRNGWQGEMTGETEGRVSNSVEHAIYNEFGTVSMPAQPMMHPAAEEARGPLEEALRQAFS